MKAEISFDLIMKDKMEFVEGTYRLPGHDWQVFIFGRRHSLKRREIKKRIWPSGVSGVTIFTPKSEAFNKVIVMNDLSKQLGVTEWIEVKGPDSMKLR